MARTASHVKNPVNHAKIGARIGKDRSYVSKLLAGKRKASLPIAIAIFDVAGIAIGPLEGKDPQEIATLKAANEMMQQGAA